MPDCIFCKIIQKEIPSKIIWENAHAIAFLDIHPITDGHTLVVPKTHFESFHAIPLEELKHLIEAVQTASKIVMAAFHTPDFHWAMNNGQHAGQLIPHIHFHLLPRKKGDGLSNWHHATTPTTDIETVYQKIIPHQSKNHPSSKTP